ncbi:MAG: nucleotidase [Frankiales bacterium]|nr:nucleotidase [Frankiales bacterium]
MRWSQPVEKLHDYRTLPAESRRWSASTGRPGEAARIVICVSSAGLAVFDIDGVVADVRHRLHYLRRRPKAWTAFLAAADQDPPLADGIALVNKMRADYEIAWLTGRPEWLRDITSTWLAQHGLPTANLVMRGDYDYRPAREMKLQAMRTLPLTGVVLFVDDDPEVIDAVSADGYPARLATWVRRSRILETAQEQDGRT